MKEGCGRQGVALDAAAYRRGREDGLRIFCTEKNGFAWGESGREYHGVCPKDQAEGFLRGYREGNRQFRGDEKVRELKERVDTLEAVNRAGKKMCTSNSDCGESGTCSSEFLCSDSGACDWIDVCHY
jgi:hypothetical protein